MAPGRRRGVRLRGARPAASRHRFRREGDAVRRAHRGVIYAIGPSPKDVNLIWVGSDDGLVHATRDGGAHWTDVTPKELTAWSKVTQIDPSHFDPTPRTCRCRGSASTN